MRLLFVPDSFKGTLTSVEVCKILARAAKAVFKNIETLSVPVADGGEGSLDVFDSLNVGKKLYAKICNALFEEKNAPYIITDDKTAIIESAVAAGLPEIYDRRNPRLTTTYGVGMLISDALEKGARKIVITLGGSSTNDGGVGLAAALSAEFYDKYGKKFIPTGGTLTDIVEVDFHKLGERIKGIDFSAMCDVEAVLCGKNGAAYVYAPQKGASENDLPLLDRGLKYLNEIWIKSFGKDFSALKGGGAAGGMGAGIAAFLGGRLEAGIEAVLKLTDFENKARSCDCVITGEGRLDEQSFTGKVVSGVSAVTRRLGKKLVIISGAVQNVSKETLDKYGVSAVYATNPDNLPFEAVKKTAAEDLYKTAIKMFSDMQ